MPIYEYECTACHHRFEVTQRFSDEPVRTCPQCGQSVRRLLFPAGIIFKGSGFYITDNRKSNGASSDGAEKRETASATSESKND
ncbi:MAG: zinc ribbon domain-containing protein [Thermorudis peleae]|nr:zinc ribbon domain-containing protein [Thermorudis peleae]